MTITTVLLTSSGAALAADHYVRAGASGDGRDWQHAFGALPDHLERGGVYWIASGEYPGYTFDDDEIGDSWITIRKATAANHGTDSGWQSEYGNGTAHFLNTLSIAAPYIELDGQVGQGNDPTTYGLRVSQGSACASSGRYLIYVATPNHDIRIRHIDLEHCGEYSEIPNGKKKILYAVGSVSRLNLSYAYLHDVSVTMMSFHSGVVDTTIEHSFFERRQGDIDGSHGEAISWNGSGLDANNIIRDNVFKDVSGTGFVVIKDSVQGGFHIYGNLFYHTDDSYHVSNGSIANTGGDTNTNMAVHNNTFVDVRGYNAGIYWNNGSQNNAYNNMWINCEAVHIAGTEHDFNVFSDGDSRGEAHAQLASNDLFADYFNHDYQLANPTDAGLTLPAPFHLDAGGQARGSDGVWDRGAFEYSTGVEQIPAAPENLRVVEH